MFSQAARNWHHHIGPSYDETPECRVNQTPRARNGEPVRGLAT